MALTNRKKALLSGLITVLVIVILLGLAESSTRLRQWLNFGTTESFQSIYHIDPITHLRVPIAGKKIGGIEINSDGFRGPELEHPKPKGRVRIAFLGASTTFCAEVSSNEASWPQIVAKTLDTAFPNTSVDFLNAGIPGYVSAGSRKNLDRRVAGLQPDIIFIYHATNDLSKDTRRLATTLGLYDPEKKPKYSWLARYSHLWKLAEKNYHVLMAQQKASRKENQLQFNPEDIGESFYRHLTALVKDAKRHAPIVAIATFSTRLRTEQSQQEKLDAAKSALYFMPYMTPTGLIQGFKRYNEIIRKVAREQGIILIEGEDGIPGDGAHFNDSVHFTDLGSKAMAKRVSKALLDSKAIQQLMTSKSRQ